MIVNRRYFSIHFAPFCFKQEFHASKSYVIVLDLIPRRTDSASCYCVLIHNETGTIL